MSTQEKMLQALKLVKSLDKPYREGLADLEAAGFDNANRFDVPASKFVENKANEAIALAS